MIYKELLPSDIKTDRSYLNQLVDILQEDISGSTSRRKFQHFITGGIGPGVTSSIFQTVYDQDFTLQTANPIFDITYGINPSAATKVLSGNYSPYQFIGTDSSGKEMFASSSLMMREKMDVYREFAQTLLGDSNSSFQAPFGSTATNDTIDNAVFIAFKRLFHRDSIKRETFALKWYSTASNTDLHRIGSWIPYTEALELTGTLGQDLYKSSISGSHIYTDVGSSNNKLVAFGGQVGNVVDASTQSVSVGLLFYDRGVLVLDAAKVISGSQPAVGYIDAVSVTGWSYLDNTYVTGSLSKSHKFIPDFVSSASIDNILDHVCQSRFQSGSLTAATFQNVTNVNSTLVFCRAAADEFNYSSNPTFTDDQNAITVIDPGSEDYQTSFTFINSIGLYDSNDNLLAVAKLSRPIEKNSQRDFTGRVRIDYSKKSSLHSTK